MLLKLFIILGEVKEYIMYVLIIIFIKGLVINVFEYMWGYFKK